uniref:Uncharacterized protein n=1 Tax=Arundo donax TaxID=35708 RepID=A0A0A9DLD5_ARUDO
MMHMCLGCLYCCCSHQQHLPLLHTTLPFLSSYHTLHLLLLAVAATPPIWG